MATTDLTSTTSVRAVLGISELELRDDILLDPIYTVRLTEAMYEKHLGLYDKFLLVAGIAELARTPIQQRFFDLVQTYAAYHVASQCLGSVAMFAPKIIKDSKSELQRTDDPYTALRESVIASLLWIAAQLMKVYGVIEPTSLVVVQARTMALAAPLGINPVTGA